MAKLTLNQLHQLPEDHPISLRDRISLSHVDTAGILQRQSARLAKTMAAGKVENRAAASSFSIGQTVRTRRGETGPVVKIDGGKVSVEIAGRVRAFAASMIAAV